MAKQYIMKGLDAAFWHRVQAKAASEDRSVKAIILRLLTQWLDQGEGR